MCSEPVVLDVNFLSVTVSRQERVYFVYSLRKLNLRDRFDLFQNCRRENYTNVVVVQFRIKTADVVNGFHR